MPNGFCSLGGEQDYEAPSSTYNQSAGAPDFPGEICPGGEGGPGSPRSAANPSPLAMPRLRPCSATSSALRPGTAPPGLRVIDEGPRQPAAPVRQLAPRWDALSPMPLTGPPDLADTDFFEDGFLPPRQFDHEDKMPALPRFVPLDLETFPAAGDPWAIRSGVDFLRIYLPEISISTGLIAASGVMGARIFSRFAGDSLGLEVLAAYLGIHTLCLVFVYSVVKGAPSVRNKGRMKNLLLAAFLFLGAHLLAHSLLVVAK